MKFMHATALCAFGLLASCGLNEKQCTQGDWAAIGKADGVNGRAADHIQKHAKSCAKHGVAPNQSLWESGRQIGLKTYCTPQNVYFQGRKGNNLRDVCPSADQAILQAANDKGKSYYRYDREINDLENEQAHLRGDIRDLLKTPNSPESAARIQLLRSEILQLQMRINHLQLQRQRYARL